MKKSTLWGALALVATLVLAGCAGATDAKEENKDKGPSIPGGTATAPTVASLVGTWKQTSIWEGSSENESGTYTYTGTTVTTLTFNADGTYQEDEVETDVYDDNARATEVNYSGSKGTFTVAGIAVTKTETEHRSSSTPFANASAGWSQISSPNITTRDHLLSGGKLYDNVATAVGEVDGLVGTWVFTRYSQYGTEAGEYFKQILTFDANGNMVAAAYESTTTTFSDTPNYSMTMKYSLTDGGKITNWQESDPTKTSAGYCAIFGNYLVTSGGDSLNSYTKQ